MAIASYKDLCIDASPGERLGRFWAAALGLQFEPGDSADEAGALSGPEQTQRVWLNVVPESKTVKHRVHLDVHCASVDDLVALGATVLTPASESQHWTILADPEGGEFCAFERAPDALPDYRLYELGIDAAEPREIATWWADVYGAKLGGDPERNWWWLEEVPDLPFEGWVFAAVPERKTVKNRIHWDVLTASVDALVAAGATLVRGPTPQVDWSVMADPEGNEFCAFVTPA